MTEIFISLVAFIVLALVGKSLTHVVQSFSTERILTSIYFILFLIFSALGILLINVLMYIHL